MFKKRFKGFVKTVTLSPKTAIDLGNDLIKYGKRLDFRYTMVSIDDETAIINVFTQSEKDWKRLKKKLENNGWNTDCEKHSNDGEK